MLLNGLVLDKLHWNTVTNELKEVLMILVEAPIFDSFRLVGGTALSLQRGHRLSVDIDLFTAVEYGSVDFEAIYQFLEKTFSYVDTTKQIPVALEKSYYVGHDSLSAVKLDLFYTDAFIQDVINKEGIRMATVEEIIAMKLDVIQRGGRKKDFWDIHEMLDTYTLSEMLALHNQRYPYTHEAAVIRANMEECSLADDDFDPNCLQGKLWPFIKQDIIEKVYKKEK